MCNTPNLKNIRAQTSISLNMLRTLHQPIVGQNHLSQSPFYHKVLNISCSLLNNILKVKNIRVGSLSVVYPHHHTADWACGSLPLPSTTTYCCLGKDQNSKYEEQFLLNMYYFYMIMKLKNPRSNYFKLRTISIGK